MKTVNLKYILLTLIVVAGVGLALISRTRPEVAGVEERRDQKSTMDMLGTVINNEDAVEVSVTPKTLSDEFWTFEVMLNTHSIELSYDLAQASALIDEKGSRYKAVTWEGDPPGGHHREGVLKFSGIYPRQENIELRIKLGDKERSFK